MEFYIIKILSYKYFHSGRLPEDELTAEQSAVSKKKKGTLNSLPNDSNTVAKRTASIPSAASIGKILCFTLPHLYFL